MRESSYRVHSVIAIGLDFRDLPHAQHTRQRGQGLAVAHRLIRADDVLQQRETKGMRLPQLLSSDVATGAGSSEHLVNWILEKVPVP